MSKLTKKQLDQIEKDLESQLSTGRKVAGFKLLAMAALMIAYIVGLFYFITYVPQAVRDIFGV